MKKCAVWVLLFFAAFSLFAQNTDDVTIFVPPVTGTGKSPGDNAAFTHTIIQELKSRNVTVKETREEASYALIGTLSPSDVNVEDGVHIMFLVLQDKDDLILYEQFFFYLTREEANVYISTILLNMLSTIFVMHVGIPVERIIYVDKQVEVIVEVPVAVPGVGPAGVPVEVPIEVKVEIKADHAEDGEAWRNRQRYIGANFFGTPRIYYGTKAEFFPFNFGCGISVEFNLQKYGTGEMKYLKYLSFGTGMYFASDWIIASPRIDDGYWNVILQIPLTIYGVFKPGAIFLHQPYFGILFNIPLLPETIPYLLSWKAGFQYGVKAGRGVVYGDIGFSMDFGKSGLNANRPGNTRQYDRYMLYLGIGYKYDLLEPAVEFIKNIIQDSKNMTQTAKSVQEPEEPAEEETGG